jgi:hypothetical protein
MNLIGVTGRGFAAGKTAHCHFPSFRGALGTPVSADRKAVEFRLLPVDHISQHACIRAPRLGIFSPINGFPPVLQINPTNLS